ncbi:ASCH domain-containing protein [Xenorhabdus griffiniae]|uniref:ASCH domain-containing protein n=1 Tax=Xenorhabdus griffiniae TaxID=351672 RepID=A0ABY9XDN4_9GAMM|nr:ASCH domain-containing protein [Xenorhabdus griffiniae]MBD1229535.1 ASCH domain-containing protein [Xenorhabdus griffiniae]MBE8588903.1 ASCH domain-containing protein [Xenorhabdus griffiniae]WMV70948.1 ASCH domain-containing protein [Xenorhabdus griffiniae]WNH00624.1 ASCH domain-containing protein [Xenorhabdus griffiniae]
MKVLLSIKPEFVEKILEGTKKYEFRKGIFKNSSVKSVVIYATKPVGKVVGEFNIEHIIEDTPSSLWSITKQNSGISKLFFDEYFKRKNKAFAIQIGDVQKYDYPISLDELSEQLGKRITAPQSYCYLPIPA